jgi:hypothetical protein
VVHPEACRKLDHLVVRPEDLLQTGLLVDLLVDLLQVGHLQAHQEVYRVVHLEACRQPVRQADFHEAPHLVVRPEGPLQTDLLVDLLQVDRLQAYQEVRREDRDHLLEDHHLQDLHEVRELLVVHRLEAHPEVHLA